MDMYTQIEIELKETNFCRFFEVNQSDVRNGHSFAMTVK